jgi:hypothetical protein
MKKSVGYIVVPSYGYNPVYLQEGVLWFGGRATLFSTYQAARNAVRRTKTYAKKNKYPWVWWDKKPNIMQVVR